jgi:hypothetical protein
LKIYVALFLLLMLPIAMATSPCRIPFQASGFKLANGTLIASANVSTYVYTAQTGGSPLYSETWATGLQNGYVSVTMGNDTTGNPLNLDWGTTYWLAVSINGTPITMVDSYGVSASRQAFISTQGEIVQLTQTNASLVTQTSRVDVLNSTILTLNNLTLTQIAANLGNYSASQLGIYTNITNLQTSNSSIWNWLGYLYSNITSLQTSNTSTNTRITDVNNTLNTLNNLSYSQIASNLGNFSFYNSSLARTGYAVCSAGTVMQNVTSNLSGIYANCTTVTSGGTPGGSNTQVQFNDGGSFGGDANLTFNKSTALLKVMNNVSNSYSVGDPASVSETVVYDADDGKYAFHTGSIPGEVGFGVTVWAYKNAPQAPSGRVYSAVPAGNGETIYLEDPSRSFYIYASWSAVAGADGYYVASTIEMQFEGNAFFIPIGQTEIYVGSNDVNDAIANATGYVAPLASELSPQTYITYGDALKVVGNGEVNGDLTVNGSIQAKGILNVSGLSYANQTFLINTGSNVIELSGDSAGGHGSGIYLSTSGSPRVCLQVGSQRLCFDYYAGSMRFIEDSSLANMLSVSATTGEFNLFSGGYGGVVDFTINHGKVTEYNDIATEGSGAVVVKDDVSLSAQTTNITTTAFTNAETAGQYRVSYYVFTSIAGYANAGNVSVNILWNDGTTARTYTMPINMTLNSTTSALSYYNADMYIRLGSGSISYNATVFGNRSASTYKFYATAERLN